MKDKIIFIILNLFINFNYFKILNYKIYVEIMLLKLKILLIYWQKYFYFIDKFF